MSTGNELLILVPRISGRVNYIFGWMFSGLINSSILTEDRDVFLKYGGPKCQYGGQQVQTSTLFWPAVPLLFEKGIRMQPTDFSLEKVIFKYGYLQTPEYTGDPFADCFYLISRYEEYLPYTADSYGRFPAASSVLHKKGLLQFPLADFLKQKIVAQVCDSFPELIFTPNVFKATITIDIDQAFAYQSKSMVRTIGSLIKAVPATPGQFLEELSVITGRKHDPFDVYDHLLADQKKNLPLIFFLLCSTSHNRYDHPVNIHSTVFSDLVKKLDSGALVGIHPSFYSSGDAKRLHQEISLLRGIIDKPVVRSRQHYLRMTFPETYRHLLDCAVKEDYTMGYSEQPGFRAGTCHPFNWYDLQKESSTELRIFPISFLEISFKEHDKNDFEGGWEKMAELMETVKQFSGHLVPVWHNHTVAGWGKYKGWTINYRRMVEWLQENINGE